MWFLMCLSKHFITPWVMDCFLVSGTVMEAFRQDGTIDWSRDWSKILVKNSNQLVYTVKQYVS